MEMAFRKEASMQVLLPLHVARCHCRRPLLTCLFHFLPCHCAIAPSQELGRALGLATGLDPDQTAFYKQVVMGAREVEVLFGQV